MVIRDSDTVHTPRSGFNPDKHDEDLLPAVRPRSLHGLSLRLQVPPDLHGAFTCTAPRTGVTHFLQRGQYIAP